MRATRIQLKDACGKAVPAMNLWDNLAARDRLLQGSMRSTPPQKVTARACAEEQDDVIVQGCIASKQASKRAGPSSGSRDNLVPIVKIKQSVGIIRMSVQACWR